MRILAVDTASALCSVALWSDGDVSELCEEGPARHAEQVLPMVDRIMQEAGTNLAACDAIAFDRGPGSFTALRIGTGIVQGLGYTQGLPIVPVSSLTALASRGNGQSVAVAMDARMGQIFFKPFPNTNLAELEDSGERLLHPDAVTLPGGGAWLGIGDGWDRYLETLDRVTDGRVRRRLAPARPTAGDIARIGADRFRRGICVSAAEARPQYLRNNVTTGTGSCSGMPR